MSTRIWPDTLPGIIEPGFELRPIEQSIRTDMEVGHRRLRRISTARGDSVTVGWKMTDREMAALRAWHGDEAWSLNGASDDVTGWSVLNASVSADTVTGPALQLADRIVEDTSDGVHRINLDLATVLDDEQVSLCATLKAAGRDGVRIGLVDRAGVWRSVDVDLADGTLSGEDNILSATATARGQGWWRVVVTAAAGTGGATAKARIGLKDAAGLMSYVGDGVSGVSVCEVNARLSTGYDLFLPTGPAGLAFGAAGGSAWVLMPLPIGGGFQDVEARFEAPFEAKVLPGLGWHITARLEVRYA